MSKMSTKAKHFRNAATLDSLYEDLLGYAKEFRKNLNDLLTNRKTEDNKFYLSGEKVEGNSEPIVFNEDDVKWALETLDTLSKESKESKKSKENAIDVINLISNIDLCFCLFPSFKEMIKWKRKISKCEKPVQ